MPAVCARVLTCFVFFVQSCDPSVVDIEHIPEGADADAPVIQMVRLQIQLTCLLSGHAWLLVCSNWAACSMLSGCMLLSPHVVVST
jgi:hypothetical protein